MLYMYDCRSPLPGASIWCYICTTAGVHYQERPSGAIYVRLQESITRSVHLVLYMYDCRSPLPGASIWCYICTTVGPLPVHLVLYMYDWESITRSVHLVLYMYDCRSPLPGASIWCYICTTVGAHYQERPSGAIYVRL